MYFYIPILCNTFGLEIQQQAPAKKQQIIFLSYIIILKDKNGLPYKTGQFNNTSDHLLR